MANQTNVPVDKYTYHSVDAAQKAYDRITTITNEVMAGVQRGIWDNIGEGRAVTFSDLKKGTPEVRQIIYKNIRKEALSTFEGLVGPLNGDMDLYAPAILSSFGISEPALEQFFPDGSPMELSGFQQFTNNTLYRANEAAKGSVIDRMDSSVLDETITTWTEKTPGYTVQPNLDKMPPKKKTDFARKIFDNRQNLEEMVGASELTRKAPQH